LRHLTIHEAADALHLSVPTIKRYIYDGKLLSTKLPGGQHRIPASEIERLLALSDTAPREHEEAYGSRGGAEQRIEVLERWVMELEADVARLGAALEVVSRFCARRCEDMAPAPVLESEATPGTRVAVLGPGCKRCDSLHDLAARALGALGRPDVTVERVTNLDDIATYGPVLTPALVVNDVIVLSGRVPTEAVMRDLLTRSLR